MRFISTRDSSNEVGFSEALKRGLAADGGLFVPKAFPRFHLWEEMDPSFLNVASQILTPFLHESVTSSALEGHILKAFHFPIPLTALDAHTSMLELFHGPTAAFKDIAAQFLAEAMSLIRPEGPVTILVATSGDTGGAVASAFAGRPGFRVVILFPHKGVSPLQRQQLTCWDDNIISLAMEGTFDDCQRLVKNLLAKPEWVERWNLTSANSINLARLLPQSLYYASSAMTWYHQRQQPATFVIPTGNMGNAVAAFWARAMGFPIQKIVMATNENKVLPHFYQTGLFEPRASQSTLANAMDVGNPSNFERLVHLIPDWAALKSFSASVSVSDPEIAETIRWVHRHFGIVICPHTACAFAARNQIPEDAVVVATAHPAKFLEVIAPLVPGPIPIPESLQQIQLKPSRFKVLAPDLQKVVEILKSSGEST